MNKELKQLLESYNEQQADLNFIYEALKIIIEYYDINDMIKNIGFDEYKNNVLGYYNYINGEILFNPILTYGKSKNIYLHNLRVLQIILHECDHVLQYKKIETQNDIEAEYLKIILQGKIIFKQIEPYLNGRREITDKEKLNMYTNYSRKHREFNKSLGKINPTERIAEINSYKEIKKIITKGTNIYQEFQEILKEKCLVGYETKENEILSPFIQYIDELIKFHYDKEMCEEFKNKILTKSKTMSLETRMYYGLPITKKEYNNY